LINSINNYKKNKLVKQLYDHSSQVIQKYHLYRVIFSLIWYVQENVKQYLALTRRNLIMIFLLRDIFLLLMFLPLVGLGFHVDIGKNANVPDVLSEQLKADSTTTFKLLDSAFHFYDKQDYAASIKSGEQAYQLLKESQQDESLVECMLLLARAYQNMHHLHDKEADFNNILKYYLKTITFLESADSKVLLPRIYQEYGDFYASLDLTRLTLNNYEKALESLLDDQNVDLKIELLREIAKLNEELNLYNAAIKSYNQLAELYQTVYDSKSFVKVLTRLTALYRQVGDYDNALKNAKEVMMYEEARENIPGLIRWKYAIGEISNEAENRYQAKSAFVEYLELLKAHPDYTSEEHQSLRYINTLKTLGEIYKWSTDNGYLSDYELAIRHLNMAYKNIDPGMNPGLASNILNQTAGIYFNKEDYKTSLTYFELSVYFARKANDLEAISESYIMLARAYDQIDKWKEASRYYELHSSCKDSIIRQTAAERRMMDEISVTRRMDNLKVEETLDRIEALERQELTIAEKELRNESLVRMIEIYKQNAELKEALLANRKLAEDSVKRSLLLANQSIENLKNKEKIDSLRAEKAIQEQLLKNQEADRENKRQQIKILEQENTLARSRQAYYVLSIVLISLVLIFIIVVYIQKRRANTILKMQNEQIERQATKLKEAYQNLELLSTIGRDITATLIIEEITETVYANINTLMDASVLGIGVFDEEQNQLLFPGVIERHEQLKRIRVDLSNKNTLAALCFLDQKEIVINDYYNQYQEYIKPHEKPYPGDNNSSSIVYLPLTIGSTKLGVLTVQSFSEHAFNKYHINIIRNIAIYTKIALENANVYRELEQKSKSLIAANKNISEKNLLIEEQNQLLTSMNEEKNNLMKILAHDLRNPLATAMSMTELVRYENDKLSAEQQQASEIIWRGLNRMNEMIRKILDVKAVESQKVLLEFDYLNANEILPSIRNNFSLEAEQKDIDLCFETECNEPIIKVDRNYFNQVIENLVSNAIKFSQAHSRILIKTADSESTIHIIVQDEGPGIPADELPQLFKKYHKLSTKPTAGEQSIGLGLSIVKKYVEVMNGNVWCESKVGEGTRFIVAFRREFEPVSS